MNKKLPKKFKEKWIKALRSEEYIQEKGALKGINGYCCLGVACRIVHPFLYLHTSTIVEDVAEKATKVPKLLKGYSDNPIVDILVKMNDNDIIVISKLYIF